MLTTIRVEAACAPYSCIPTIDSVSAKIVYHYPLPFSSDLTYNEDANAIQTALKPSFNHLVFIESEVDVNTLNVTPAFLESELRSSLDTRCHWSPSSQPYAPVAILMQYLADGWHITPMVGSADYHYGGSRYVTIYYFELKHGEQKLLMRVHGNPVLRRWLYHHPCQFVPINEFLITHSGRSLN